MSIDETKSRQVAANLEFLKTLNKSTEDYLYLLELQRQKVWMFGGVEEVFQFGDKEDEGCYQGHAWIDAVYTKDKQGLMSDIKLISNGKKISHNMDYRMLKKNGKYIWVNCQGTVQLDEEGNPFIMIGRISETALHYKIDTLTGLFNLEQMVEDVKQTLADRQNGYFLQLGIDNLKNINTRHGRVEGDKALQLMAKTLEGIDDISKAYRLVGDVFAVTLIDVSEQKVSDIYMRVQQAVEGKFTVSGGAVPLNIPDMDINQLLQYSEFALDKAKKKGKNSLAVFDEDDYRKKEVSVSLLGEMMDSVRHGCTGFSLVFQPQIRMADYKLFGAEALLRYASPTRGRVFPDEFIPILENSELMYPVGLWVLKQGLAQCREWRKKIPEFHISVNISYRQLSNPAIIEDVLDALKESGLPGDALTLEVTESMQLQNYQYYNDIFSTWKKMGILISVDDFGTGYSSLGYLKELNIDEIKIDRCFVSGIQNSSYNYLLLSNVVELAAGSQIRVCCEGVEEEDELQVLEELNPDLLQGYFFSRPCDKEEFEKLFSDKGAPEDQWSLRYAGRSSGSKVSRLLNLQHKEILKSVKMGLWVVRILNDGHKIEMYADEMMREIMGQVTRLSPSECYTYWFEHLCPEYRDYIAEQEKILIETGEIVDLKYEWEHPVYGRVEVRSAAVRIESEEGEICIHGCHRVMEDGGNH